MNRRILLEFVSQSRTKMLIRVFLIVLNWFTFIQAFDQCVEPCLIFINQTQISYKSVLAYNTTDHLRSFVTVDQSLTKDVKAFDYHYEEKLIFWFQKSTRKIFSSGFLYNSAIQDLGVSVGDIVGLAVDWNYDNLYWIDEKYGSLDVSTISGLHQSRLFKRDLEIPQYITYGGNGNIFTAWRKRTVPSDFVIFQSNVGKAPIQISTLRNVIGLAINRENKKLFVAATGKLHSVDFDGLNPSTTTTITMQSLVIGYGLHFLHPSFKIVFETSVPVTSRQKLALLNVDKVDTSDKIVMYDNYTGAYVEADFCKEVGCDHLCLYAPSWTSFVCACAIGYSLSADGKSCANVQPTAQLISVAAKTNKQKFNFLDIYNTSTPDHYTHTSKDVEIKNILPLKSTTISSQVYAKGGSLYYLDDDNGMLCEFNLTSNRLTILDASFSYSNGKHLQYDDISRLFYFIDSTGKKLLIANKNGEIGVLVMAMDFILVDLALSSKFRYFGTLERKTGIYQFTTYRLTGQKIRTFTLGPNKVGPVTIDDETENKVVWYDHLTKTIVTHDVTSSNIENKIVLLNGIGMVTTLTTYKGFLVWITDYEKLYMASLSEQNPKAVLVKDFKTTVVYAVTPSTSTAGSSSYRCFQNNGGCSHFCLQLSQTQFVCHCPEGMVLDQVKLKCTHRSSDTMSMIVCEYPVYNTEEISCPENTSINIVYASYGRRSSEMCSSRSKVTNCHSSKSWKVVYEKCQQKRSCSLIATNPWFSDPCPGVVKYLEVRYQCIKRGPICPSPCLYYTNGGNILRVSLQGDGVALNGPPQLLYKNGTDSIKAFGIHFQRDFLFWTDHSKIYRASTTGNAIQIIREDDAVDVRGIAVDELNDVIYWTDFASEKIFVSTLDGKVFRTILDSNIKKPTSIVVEPYFMNGVLFWINDVDNMPTLGRSGLAGQNLQFFKVMEPNSNPGHLAIDRSQRAVYWTSKKGVVSVTYSGANSKYYTFNSSSGFTLYPTSGLMYGIRKNGLSLKQYKPNEATKPNIVIHNMSSDTIMKMAIRSTAEVISTCFDITCNNGFCLGGKCECDVGYKISNGSCVAAGWNLRMIVMKNNGFYMYKTFSYGVTSNELGGSSFLNETSPVSFDVDWIGQEMFWIDSHHHSIMKTSLDSLKTVLLLSRANLNLSGLKYDHLRHRLYWLENHAVYSCSSADGSMVNEIYSAEVVERVLVAYAIRKGYIFSYTKKGSLKQGSIQSHTEYDIYSERFVTALAVDEYSEQLFFITNDQLKSCKFDGQNLRIVIAETVYSLSTKTFVKTGDSVDHTSALQIVGDTIYWFQKRRQVLYQADKWFSSNIQVVFGIAANTSFVMDFKIAAVYAEAKAATISNYTFSYLGSSLTERCAASGCSSNVPQKPPACPAGYINKRTSNDICAQCDQPLGSQFACKCKDWVTCNHRWATDVGCNGQLPFMKVRGRQCQKTIRTGFCPVYSCAKGTVSTDACITDNQCGSGKKCCATRCGNKCLSQARQEISECATNNGGCSHLCVANMYREAVCKCPENTLLDADEKSCVADNGFCAENNPCLGYLCVDYPDTYVCVCPSPLYGDHCEFGHCLSNPCINGGSCVDLYGDFMCQCIPGFGGRYCEARDVCEGHLCSNHSTCAKDPTTSSYICVCDGSYTGTYCEEQNFCYSSPCQHGGSCVPTSDERKFFCSCPNNYVGQYCQDLHPCLKGVCLNGAVCSPKGEKYLCLCPKFYTGDNCQINYANNVASLQLKHEPERTITKQSFQQTMAKVYTDFCSENDCVNGLLNGPRKRRSNSITILPDHIEVVIGYPKEVGTGEVQVLYTVLIPLTPGSSVNAKLIDVEQLLEAAQKSEKIINNELGASIVKVSKYEQPKPTDAPSNSDNSNLVLIGAASGGGVIVLVVFIVTIGCCVVKRKKDISKDVHITMQHPNGSSVYFGKLNPSFQQSSIATDSRYSNSAHFFPPTRSTIGAAPPPPDYNGRGADGESLYQGIEEYSQNDDVFYLESQDVKAAAAQMGEDFYTGLNNNTQNDVYSGLNTGRSVENPYTGLTLTPPQVESSYVTPNMQRRADTTSVPEDILARERERSRQTANSSTYAVYGSQGSEDYLALDQ